MALLALIAFLLASSLVVISAEPVRRARQRKVELHEKRQEEEADEKARAEAESKEEADRQREEEQRRRQRLTRPEGFRARIETVRARDLVPMVGLEAVRKSATDRAERLTRWARDVVSALPAKGGAIWSRVAAVLVGGLWLAAFAVELVIDQRSFVGLGYNPGLAALLAAITAFAFSLMGLALSDLLGFTRILPLPEGMRRITRGVLVADVLAVLIFGLSMLSPVMTYRSAPIAAQVQTLEQNEKVLERNPEADPRLESDVESRLAAAKERLETSHYADQRLGIGAALLETLTSWGAVWLGMVTVGAALATLASRAKRKSEQVGIEIAEREQRFHAELAALAEEVEISPEQLREMLNEPDGGAPEPPASAPEPSQNASSEPPPVAEEPPQDPAEPPPRSAPEDPPRQQQSDPPPDDWPAF